MSNNNYSSPSVSTLGLLGVVFVTLKLTKVIDWSWLWVLAPFWGPLALAAFIFLFMYTYFIIKGNK